jgi:hypothetical protein
MELDMKCLWFALAALALLPGTARGEVWEGWRVDFEDGTLGGEGEDGWKVVSFRLAGDSSLPQKWTPRHLLSVVVWVQANQAGRVVAGIDWLRLRSFTPEEEEKEKEWVPATG